MLTIVIDCIFEGKTQKFLFDTGASRQGKIDNYMLRHFLMVIYLIN